MNRWMKICRTGSHVRLSKKKKIIIIIKNKKKKERKKKFDYTVVNGKLLCTSGVL